MSKTSATLTIEPQFSEIQGTRRNLMKANKKTSSLLVVLAATLLGSTAPANAAITVVTDEDFAGNMINDPSIVQVTSGVTCSGNQAVFPGINGQYLVQANPYSGATNNFGAEAFITLDTHTTGGDGFLGLLSWDASSYAVISNFVGGGGTATTVGGHRSFVGDFGQVAIPPIGQEFHVALVLNGGTTEVYINGVLTGTDSNGLVGGSPPFLELGAFKGQGETAFRMNRVRTFTFNAGEFNASTDLLTAVPEPTAVTLLGMACIGLLASRRYRLRS